MNNKTASFAVSSHSINPQLDVIFNCFCFKKVLIFNFDVNLIEGAFFPRL